MKILLSLLLLSGCLHNDTTVKKSKLLASDYRLFYGTPAEKLAKAVIEEDTMSIRMYSGKNGGFIDFREPAYGVTLLHIAIYQRKYASVKYLLEHGADPNRQDNTAGESAVMEAADLGIARNGLNTTDSRFLMMTLKHGGNPNSITKNDPHNKKQFHSTALINACRCGALDYVRILIASGANVNLKTEDGYSPLCAAAIQGNPEIVRYLLGIGADFNQPLITTIDGKKVYLLNVVSDMNFPKGSKDFQIKNEIVQFLKERNAK
ncbi:MAG TPA: ankyrin repeat domain-containing protein [Mucilaginibacter sp.]